MKTIEERFWIKVNKDGPIPVHVPELGKCWVWIAGKNDKGYGFFYIDGKTNMSHRCSFTLAGGIIDSDKLMCHRCDNPSCVRPSLFFRVQRWKIVWTQLLKAGIKNLKRIVLKGIQCQGTICAFIQPMERGIAGNALGCAPETFTE